MRIESIIFDLDGTLFNYDLAETSALKKTFLYFNLSYKNQFLADYRKINKTVWDDFEQNKISIKRLKVKRFEILLDKLGKTMDPVSFSEKYLYFLGLESQLINGAETLLQKLFGEVNLILMTNGIKEVQRSRLKHSSITHFFSDIIISDEVGVAKPANEIFEIALRHIDNPVKNKILMVGDNLSSDIKGGADFGLQTCWYNPKCLQPDPKIHPDYEIKSLDEILKLQV